MPELPEVHTITKDLKKYASTAKITDVEIVGDYEVASDKDYFIKNLKNQHIKEAFRVAKNIVLGISSDHYLTIHLAMTGKLLLRKKGHPKDKHERVRIYLEKNGRNFELRFCDMRKFGKVDLIHKSGFDKFTQKYGPDLLSTDITPESFLKQLKSKNTNIKNALLDQKIVAGLGNVYVTDALWTAKIHPETRTNKVTPNQAEKLLESIQEVLNEGIKNRGISMSDYVDLLGNKGRQQNYFRIYQQDTCPRCENETIFKKLNGRGTYFCPSCQPKNNQPQLL